MNKKKTDWVRVVGWIVFVGYLAVLMYFMFFADLWGRTHIRGDYTYNLHPLQEILRFIRYRDSLGFWPVFLNLGGNVIGFMPFGFCMPLLDRQHRRWYVIVLESLLFSVCIETIQLVSRVGSCDVDDVILNTLGGLLGYLVFRIALKIRRKHHAA
jgi:glycopeptide antibiotics resistance protein